MPASLPANILKFCTLLRHNGYQAGHEESALALQVLATENLFDNINFYHLLRAVFCRKKEDLEKFDALFKSFWRDRLTGETSSAPPPPKQREKKNKAIAISQWLNGKGNDDEPVSTATWSSEGRLEGRDFSVLRDDGLEDTMRIIHSLSRQLASRTKRRYEKTNRGTLPDIRRTLRKNMRKGGELLELVYRRPKRNKIKLLLLCDVSRSMELYSGFFLLFMYAFRQVYAATETFIFSTVLERITPYLQQSKFNEILPLLHQQTMGWNGGTRIGACLDAFVEQYGNLVDKKTIVVIISDGWDQGDTAPIEHNMHLIHQRARKILWLNPLAGYTEYRPETAGMKAAYPHIDFLAPVHNLESLARIIRYL